MYMYVYVCVSVCMCVRTYVCMCMCVCVYVYVYVYVHLYVYVCVKCGGKVFDDPWASYVLSRLHVDGNNLGPSVPKPSPLGATEKC